MPCQYTLRVWSVEEHSWSSSYASPAPSSRFRACSVPQIASQPPRLDGAAHWLEEERHRQQHWEKCGGDPAEIEHPPLVRVCPYQLVLERKVSSRGRGRGERPHAKDADQKQGPLRTRDHFGGMPPMIRHFIVQLEESAVPAGLAHQDRWGQLVNRI
eukprot:scaffold19054_cov65-Phaeocystis_antarctica.AAC.7